jgi:hypothetical protein
MIKKLNHVAQTVLGAALTISCADTDEAERWASLEATQSPLISTYYNSGSRTIFAPDNGQIAGTPNTAITTRNIATNACRTTGPVVMNRAGARQITNTVCGSLGLSLIRLASGASACSSDRRTETPVYYYNFTSLTQTQLNYEVREYGVNGQILDRSGWQPGGPGNGCPRP